MSDLKKNSPTALPPFSCVCAHVCVIVRIIETFSHPSQCHFEFTGLQNHISAPCNSSRGICLLPVVLASLPLKEFREKNPRTTQLDPDTISKLTTRYKLMVQIVGDVAGSPEGFV